jgi:hypothetical protein
MAHVWLPLASGGSCVPEAILSREFIRFTALPYPDRDNNTDCKSGSFVDLPGFLSGGSRY